MRRGIGLGLLIALCAASTASGIGGITFQGPLSISNVPRPPVTVHSGDFNGDGKRDLVSSNGTGIVTVIFQDPTNREKWTQVPLRVGSSCYFSRGGDFDGDGLEDLIVADGASTSYFVKSKGDGTFEKAVAIPQARGARWVAMGDWNNDGRLDQASSNLNTGTLTIFLNERADDGSVKFVQTQNPASGREHTLEALDFDGDGNLDLSLGTGLPGIQLHKGQGDGKFVYKQPNVSNLGCVEYIATGDFNDDMKDDLAPTCIDDGNGYLGISVGDGKYTRALAAPFGAGTESTATADLNHDGKLDLAMVSAGSGNLRVYPGLGDGKVGPPEEFGPTGTGPLFLIAEDLDADGLADVVSADTGGSSLTVFFGVEGDRYLLSAGSITGFSAARGFSIEDFDGDQNPDLLMTATSSGKAFVYLNPKDTSPTKPSLTIDVVDRYSTMTTADLNQDGVPDLAGTNLAGDSALIALLNRDGTVIRNYAMPAGDGPQDLRVGKIDPGNELDLAIPSQILSQITVYLGKGDGTFGDLIAVPTIERPKRVAIGDLNGDGRGDLAVAQPKILAFQLQNTDGTFGPPQTLLAETTRNFGDVQVVDLNSDGAQDILVTESRTLGILLFPGRGDGSFLEAVPIKLGVPPVSIFVVDIDGDRRLDVSAASTAAQAVAVVLNEGGSTFSEPELLRVGSGVTGHRIVDLDRNGVLDVVGFSAASVIVRLGKLEGPPPVPKFRRGDADGNGSVQITDAVATLNWLFRESSPLACEDAADADDNGQVNLTDAVSTLSWLFRDGPPPAAPGPEECGTDDSEDGLTKCQARC